MKNRIFRPVSVALALSVVAILTGCAAGAATSSAGDGSRVKFYTSAKELASDSGTVVIGTVTGQKVANDIDPQLDFTISDVTVLSTLKSGAVIAPGATLVVRQIGSAKQVGQAPLLAPGSTYLLYLTASGLDGALASQYYVTGGDAGIYQATTADVTKRAAGPFKQLQANPGDKLPGQVALQEAVG